MSATMSDLDLAALKAVAEAATQGKWELNGAERLRRFPDGGRDTLQCYYKVPMEIPHFRNPADGEHIARFDPPTALALVARAEEANTLEAERDRLAALFAEEQESHGSDNDRAAEVLVRVCEERDRLAAQVSAMREAMKAAREYIKASDGYIGYNRGREEEINVAYDAMRDALAALASAEVKE